MKKTILFCIIGLSIAYSGIIQAKEYTPQELEVKTMAAQLKEKRKELALVKAQTAVDKANAKLAKLQTVK